MNFFFRNNPTNGQNGHERKRTQQVLESIHARINDRRTIPERFADWIVEWFGTFSFCFVHILAFATWIAINRGIIPPGEAFDPYPFNLLTMVVSLEAIFLSIFVLINQNRASKIADLRQELDVQVNMITEQEVTKVIHLMAYLMNHLHVPYEKDPELRRMMRPLNIEEIRDELERQLRLPKFWDSIIKPPAHAGGFIYCCRSMS